MRGVRKKLKDYLSETMVHKSVYMCLVNAILVSNKRCNIAKICFPNSM